MRRGILTIIAAVCLFGCTAAYALDTNLAFRIGCEVQTAGMQSLPDLTWVQGSTPLIEAQIIRNGRQVSLSTNVRARMLISSNLYAATSWAVVTNTVLTTNAAASSMWIQWGEVGTNSCAAGTNEPSAWGYTMFFEDSVTGTRYWNGAGRLYVEKSTATGNGMTWLNPTSLTSLAWGQIYGDPTNNAALAEYIATSAGADTVARAGVASNAASIVAVGAVASNALPASATNGWEVGSHTGLATAVALNGYMPMIGGIANGTLQVCQGGNPQIGVGTVDYTGATDSAYVGFENTTGTGVFSFRESGDYGEFYLSRYLPLNFSEPWGGGTNTDLFLMTLHANLIADTITLGSVARTNWPTDGSSGISAADATNIAQNVLAASTNAHDATARASIVEVGAVASNATTAAQAFTNWLATELTNSIDGRVSAIAVTSAPPVGVESAPLNYPWATNVTLLASTNPLAQKIVIEGWTTITPGAKSSVSNYAATILTVSAIGTNTVAWVTNGSSPILGYVATFSTNAETEWVWRSPPGTTNGYLSRIR